MDLVRNNKAEAVYSAGNSGAMMASAIFRIGRLKGIDRPAIGALLLGVNGICVIGHGSSKSLSVVSALRLAHSAVNHGVMDNLNQLQKLQVLNS